MTLHQPNIDASSEQEIQTLSTEILIVGSGMGGSTLAWALRDEGQKVLVAERGGWLPQETENSNLDDVYLKHRYANAETWYNARGGAAFKPGVYYYVGGNTKVYGGCLPRFRESDFQATRHADGISPAWPFSYEELEPHYATAEDLYHVHGQVGEDSTEPPHSRGYPYPALEHEPPIQELAKALEKQGLHPFHMPNGLDLITEEDRARGATCDGAPCETGNKSDAANRALTAALHSPQVSLEIGVKVDKLVTSEDGKRIVTAIGTQNGSPVRIVARKFVLAAGAVNSSVILLKSSNDKHPAGLANSSGLVGRNYMVHNSTFFMAINPFKKNPTLWQKTLGLNDWYEASEGTEYPLGNVQMLGKLRKQMLKSATPWVPNFVLKWMTDHSVDFYLTTEDLAEQRNGVELFGDQISVRWRRNNRSSHKELNRRMKRAVRRAGFPLVATRRMGIDTNSHQCGTAVAGADPTTSVLDPNCKSHDLDNLWIVDSSFFPSSSALNPALTIAANAIRVAPSIAQAA